MKKYLNNIKLKLTFQKILIVPDGQLSSLDLVNRAFLNSINESHWVISGSQYMPQINQDHSLIIKVINICGASLYPLALSLLLPVFMYAIVHEKEERILEMMKMNGLKIINYWLVNFIFDLLLFGITYFFFFLFGNVFLQLRFFTDTDLGLQVKI